MTDLVAITSKLKAKGVELQVLAMNLDTSTPTGKLMLNLMGSFAEFEREIMLERQREGVARAKAEGKYRGRVPTAQRKAAEVVQLRGQGVKPEEIAAKLGISRASVFRVLKDRREAANGRCKSLLQEAEVKARRKAPISMKLANQGEAKPIGESPPYVKAEKGVLVQVAVPLRLRNRPH